MNVKIHTFDFSEAALNEVRDTRHCKNWPVTYLINNHDEIYIGETTDMNRRAWQHFQNPERKRLKQMRVIDDDEFNKSAIQDLEAFLIENFAADGKFSLQNGNRGLRQHNYYQRKKYTDGFKEIWKYLQSIGLAEHSLQTIRNSDLFFICGRVAPILLTSGEYILSNLSNCPVQYSFKSRGKRPFHFLYSVSES